MNGKVLVATEAPAILSGDSQMSESSRKEYIARINRAIDFIDNNLDRELTLREIAEHAWFSPFHFHRIFSGIMNETLAAFIRRVRLEKAAAQLVANPGKSVTDIAFDVGFSGSSVFSRCFRNHFGVSPAEWRSGSQANRKECKTDGKDRQEPGAIPSYSDSIDDSCHVGSESTRRRIEIMMTSKLKVEVRNLAPVTVAYVRHIGPYAGDAALFEGLFGRLWRWAGPRGMLNQKDLQVLIVYHDNPDVTDASKLRTSVCITVPKGTEVSGEVGLMDLAGGQYACGRFELTSSEFQGAWDSVCGQWLPDSGWQPDDRPCFESYLNDHRSHPEGKHVVDICVPVKPSLGPLRGPFKVQRRLSQPPLVQGSRLRVPRLQFRCNPSIPSRIPMNPNCPQWLRHPDPSVPNTRLSRMR